MAAPAPKQAPKFPNPRDITACVNYLIAYWVILAGESPAAKEVSKRLAEAVQQKTPQLAIARAIYLGPSPAMAGGEKWGKVAIALQEYVKRETKEKPIASRLGGALADVAGSVAHAASTAADSASGAAKTAAMAVAEKAGQLSSVSIPTPGDVIKGATGLFEIPATLARRTLDKITSVFPDVGAKLKEVLGDTAIGLGAVGVLAVGAYALFMFVSFKAAFHILPKLMKFL